MNTGASREAEKGRLIKASFSHSAHDYHYIKSPAKDPRLHYRLSVEEEKVINEIIESCREMGFAITRYEALRRLVSLGLESYRKMTPP